jgi:hypothetical protein
MGVILLIPPIEQPPYFLPMLMQGAMKNRGRTVRMNLYDETMNTSGDLLWQRRVYKKTICRNTRGSAGYNLLFHLLWFQIYRYYVLWELGVP